MRRYLLERMQSPRCWQIKLGCYFLTFDQVLNLLFPFIWNIVFVPTYVYHSVTPCTFQWSTADLSSLKEVLHPFSSRPPWYFSPISVWWIAGVRRMCEVPLWFPNQRCLGMEMGALIFKRGPCLQSNARADPILHFYLLKYWFITAEPHPSFPRQPTAKLKPTAR